MKKLCTMFLYALLAITGSMLAFNFDREPDVVLPEILKLEGIPAQLRASSLYSTFNNVDNTNKTRIASDRKETEISIGGKKVKIANSDLIPEIAETIPDETTKKKTYQWIEKFTQATDPWFKANPKEDLSSFLAINFEEEEPNTFYGKIWDFQSQDPSSFYAYLRLFMIYNTYQHPERNTTLFDVDDKETNISTILSEFAEEFKQKDLKGFLEASSIIDILEEKLGESEQVKAETLNKILVNWFDYALGLSTQPDLTKFLVKRKTTDPKEAIQNLQFLTESLAALVPNE